MKNYRRVPGPPSVRPSESDTWMPPRCTEGSLTTQWRQRGPSLPLLIHRFLSCSQMRNGNVLTQTFVDAGGREDAEGSKKWSFWEIKRAIWVKSTLLFCFFFVCFAVLTKFPSRLVKLYLKTGKHKRCQPTLNGNNHLECGPVQHAVVTSAQRPVCTLWVVWKLECGTMDTSRPQSPVQEPGLPGLWGKKKINKYSPQPAQLLKKKK